jgi:hypothetical protein
MKILFLLIWVLTSVQASVDQVYQVMSAHPHDVKEFTPFITTVRQEGRLWLVKLDKDTPSKLFRHFRATDGSDVKSYLYDKSAEKKLMLASPIIKEFTARIDGQALRNDVEMLANFKTRAAGSVDNQKVAAHLAQIFTELGFTVYQTCYRPGACSIIADKAGIAASSEVILIMAHFDSVGKNFAGADDNASGTAVLMEVARVLKDYGNKKTLRFFATNGEELGLLGAEHYVNMLKKTGEIKNISLAINMDMVGYNSNGIVELETDKGFEELALHFASLAQTYTKLNTKITLGAWGSDHVPFLKAGVPSILTIEDWSTKTPCYHLECDKPSSLNYDYAAEIAKLNLAAIMTKDIN